MSNYGIPYMGSKDKIVASIAMNFPKAEHFYDLFGGGFSVTHYMLVNKSKNYSHFHYNEIKSDIVDLVKKSINGDFNYNKFKPEWISRDQFFKRLDDPYVRICCLLGMIKKTICFHQKLNPTKNLCIWQLYLTSLLIFQKKFLVLMYGLKTLKLYIKKDFI